MTGLSIVLFWKRPEEEDKDMAPLVPVVNGPPVPVTPREDVGVDETVALGEEADNVMVALLVKPEDTAVGPTVDSSVQDVLLVKGNGGVDVKVVGILVSIDAVPVGPESVVLLPIGKGGEDDDGLEGIPVPIDPVPVGIKDVILPIGKGGEEDAGLEGMSVPTDPEPVGPVDKVLLLIGNGAEAGTSDGTEGVPVPKGGDSDAAVPVPSQVSKNYYDLIRLPRS
jgi:hypothetical protein